ncbi:DNA-binding protein [Clostridium botulinum]|uniref:DNA-binding protein n=1 Tax=Clostridium botulinum TaxID=1491 RepID=UPI00046FE52E|nr:DNA-binding protein [Clostridium botulinum]APQ76969.1 hypothetical protein RSJ10_2963 [Clostridium botulinum]AUN00142.1 DNA-binding protein [Clostridium botulinum]AUN18715.1 DNA-binding protein [Clostridium botulinum]KEI88133.1 DNA-binding protein [Clostridium botulinum B2 267]KOM96955.1 DNA-binding protein [Clostridium botulinum]
MLDKEKVKSSKEVVENIEKEKEEEKVQEVNEEKASENETDKINEFIEEEKSPKNKEEINKSAEEESNNNDLKNKVSFLQCFKEGIKSTLGIFVVSIGFLAVVGLVLRYILGLYVKDVWGMLFIVYLVVSLFYPYIKAKFYKKNK